MQIYYFFTSLCLFWRSVSSSFTDVTEQVGIAAINGYLAAFGDFNGDKMTDLFIVTVDGKSLEIFLWNDQKQEFTKGSTKIMLRNETIVNVSPSDFDGDGQLDVMITTEKVDATPSSSKTVYVFWGNLKTIGANVSFSISDQPLLMDANGDLLPDLFGMVKTTNSTFRAYWISKGSARDFQIQPQISSKGKNLSDPIRVPHSNAFLDLSGDFTADLFITTQSLKFELWQNTDGHLVYSQDIDLPAGIEKVTQVGQSTFADIDGDGLIDHLLPICTKPDCEESHIYVHSKDKWWHMLSNGQNPVWKFIPPSSSGHGSQLFPLMTIRTGDYNMDGFPDAVVVMAVDSEGNQNFKEVAVLLENIPCKQDRECFQHRTFSVHWEELISLDGAVLATFFDLYENGKNGIVVVTKSHDKDPPQYHLHAIRNDLYTDTCFLKVIVLGGQCFSSCPNGNLPYGVNQVGPFIKYSTTTTDGKPKVGSAAQLSQSAYFSLQCPYTVFGLGRTPNFVDELLVGMPRGNHSPRRVRSWPSIIPNSQVIIIPYPADSPSSWTAKLFVTPSKLVLLTGLSLLGICVMIGLIILLLYLKEKREDQKEKRQDAHKFHFDAM